MARSSILACTCSTIFDTRKAVLQNRRKILAWQCYSSHESQRFFPLLLLCMHYGPVACLSFNLERSNNIIHTCELSSSEKYLESQKMQRRLDYDYYGTEFQVWWPKPTHLGRLALRVGNFIIPIQWKFCLFNGKLVCSDNAPCISSILLKEEDLLPHFLTL